MLTSTQYDSAGSRPQEGLMELLVSVQTSINLDKVALFDDSPLVYHSTT